MPTENNDTNEIELAPPRSSFLMAVALVAVALVIAYVAMPFCT